MEEREKSQFSKLHSVRIVLLQPEIKQLSIRATKSNQTS
jgi:hypothetical protein